MVSGPLPTSILSLRAATWDDQQALVKCRSPHCTGGRLKPEEGVEPGYGHSELVAEPGLQPKSSGSLKRAFFF